MGQPFVTQGMTWPENLHPMPLTTGGPVTPLESFRSPYPHGEVLQPVVNGEFPYRGDWSGYRPYNASFGPYHQHQGHPQPCFHHPRQDGNSATIDPSQGYHAVPPPVPTPPASDGSPNPPEWVTFAVPEHEAQPLPKRLRRAFDTESFVARPDGVRKKNAKFDIPEERNLDTLDALIKDAKNEPEIKELKMQKRLLRNREAALHSRQKKKTHTEHLEQDNKKLVSKIQQFQHRITNLQIKIDDHEKEREDWQDRQAKTEERARRLQKEKDLQAKDNQKLAAELEHIRAQLRSVNNSSPMTNATSSSGYNECTATMNNCSLDNVEWHDNNYDFMTDLSRTDIVVH